MLICTPFFTKQFVSKDMDTKDAYLKAVKWVATNVLNNKKELSATLEEFRVIEQGKVEVTLYCSNDYNIEKELYCKMCQEMHDTKFDNCLYNCNCCNLKSLESRQKKRISIKRQYRKEILHKILRE